MRARIARSAVPNGLANRAKPSGRQRAAFLRRRGSFNRRWHQRAYKRIMELTEREIRQRELAVAHCIVGVVLHTQGQLQLALEEHEAGKRILQI